MAERRKCDIVMQGGVTSGVVYPGLIARLSDEYDFVNIGGTSAGAIAASVSAAAQYARNKDPKAFEKVAAISDWLGKTTPKGSNLFGLFQPQPQMKGLFKFALFFLIKGKFKKLVAFLTLFLPEIILGLIPGLALGYLAFGYLAARLHDCNLVVHLFAGFLAILFTIFVCAAGFALVAVFGLGFRASRIPKNFFGFCTGNPSPAGGGAPALVPWLHGQINTIAGKPLNEPLTFGDLKGAGINLQMMTTCLTWQRPFTLPFTTRQFYFSPDEFRQFFPEEVVQWLEKHPPEKHDDHPHKELKPVPIDLQGCLPLPDEEHLPVIVAARLSLSFPILFCAVPLHAIDFTLRVEKPGEPTPSPIPGAALPPEGPRRPEPVWFTDGGICNNFPMHLFDAPLPLWPTFGIDLTDLRLDRTDRTWMPQRNQSGIQPNWTRISDGGIAGVFKLVVAIVNSARNWVNSLQSAAPGYRDRIVHIALDKEEGGLNLIMPPKLLACLNQYGQQAAGLIIDHFIHGTDNGEKIDTTWDNQRWIRYRSTIAQMETFLRDFSLSIQRPELGDPTYYDLINRKPGDPPPTGYPLAPSQIPIANSETKQLEDLGNAMADTPLKKGSPKPEPRLVIRPDY